MTTDTAKELAAARAIVEKSGNTFHCKVAGFLRSKSWDVAISPYYLDYSSDKSREIDIVAFKNSLFCDPMSGKTIAILKLQLHIECKYIKQPTVFWFDDQNIPLTMSEILKQPPYAQNHNQLNQHHHLTGAYSRVAKLFSSQQANDSESEQMFKAINQCLSSLVHDKEDVTVIVGGIPPTYTFAYPVIVCSSFDHFFSVDIGGGDEPKRIARNFAMEVNYAYMRNGRPFKQHFQIDVIDWNLIDDFMGRLDVELDGVRRIIASSK